MKIKRGVDEYKMPPHSTVSHALIKPTGDTPYRLVLIGQHDMRLRRKIQDRPLGKAMYAAIYDDKIYLDPIPDLPGTIEVFYYPPIQMA